MIKKLKIPIFIFTATLLILAYRSRYISVNQLLQEPLIKRYDLGEEVHMDHDILMDFTMKGYSVTVNKAEILTYEDYLEKYNGKDEYTYSPEKIYDVSITIKNIDADSSTGININDFYIQGLAVSASIDIDLYDLANPKVNGIYQIALQNNSEMEFHLPFALWKDHYRNRIWNNLHDFEMYFVATLYPNKKIVML